MNSTNSIALILVSVGLFFLIGKPALSDVDLLKAEKEKYNAAIAQINVLESKKDELLAKMNNIPVEDREKMQTFLPAREETVRLITDIDGIASKHGISVTSASLGTPKTSSSRSIAEVSDGKAYNSRMIDITFSSNYDDLIDFVIDLEKSLRIIDIRSISFTTGSTARAASGVNEYKISMEVYWLKDLKYEKQ